MKRTEERDIDYRFGLSALRYRPRFGSTPDADAPDKSSASSEGEKSNVNIIQRLLGGVSILLDRTIALLIGVGIGSAIGISFANGGAAASKSAVETPRAQAKIAGTSAGLTGVAATRVAFAADSAAPFQAALLNKISTGKPIVVGVFGDSFGDGIWSALYRRLPRDGAYQVLKFSSPSTGFVRTEPRDVQAEADAKLAQTPVDIAVIDFGANDTQGIAKGGKGYALLGKGWRAVYGERVDRYVADLRARGVMVYWVGLPKMRKPGYDADVAALNAFYAERMAILGVPWIDTAALSEDATGAFSDYLPAPGSGEPKLMRAGDGIHMTVAGYERMAEPAVQRIEAYVARARAAAELDTPVQVASAQAKGAAAVEGVAR